MSTDTANLLQTISALSLVEASTICLQVYALDLLGFGRSDKPLMAYSTDVWKQQLLDFARNKVGEPAVYIGNSLGSLICLMVILTACLAHQ